MTVIEKSTGVQESIQIDAPPERVWRVFSDLERWPEWNPVCRQARPLSPRPWEVGARFQVSIRPWWATLPFKPQVVECRPPSRVTWLGSLAGVYGQHTFTFEPQNSGTLATSLEVFSGPMLWALPLVAPSRKVRRMVRRWLEALKAEVERGP